MNIYEVTTEELYFDEPIDADLTYTYLDRISGNMAAETRNQAKYLLWQWLRENGASTRHVTDFKASIRIVLRNVPDTEPGWLDADHPFVQEMILHDELAYDEAMQ